MHVGAKSPLQLLETVSQVHPVIVAQSEGSVDEEQVYAEIDDKRRAKEIERRNFFITGYLD